MKRIMNLHRAPPDGGWWPAAVEKKSRRAALPVAIEQLRKARALLDQGWNPGPEWGVDAEGRSTSILRGGVARWNVRGAMLAVSTRDSYGAGAIADAVVGKLIGDTDFVSWNCAPERTKPEVLELFDMAIAALELEARQ